MYMDSKDLLADGCVYTIITCLSSVWHCQAIAVVPRYYFVDGGANPLTRIGSRVLACSLRADAERLCFCTIMLCLSVCLHALLV